MAMTMVKMAGMTTVELLGVWPLLTVGTPLSPSSLDVTIALEVGVAAVVATLPAAEVEDAAADGDPVLDVAGDATLEDVTGVATSAVVDDGATAALEDVATGATASDEVEGAAVLDVVEEDDVAGVAGAHRRPEE